MPIDANILQPLIDVFNSVIKWMHNDVGLSWGVGIVLITWLSRLVVLPFTLRSMHGMREMQALQPYIKEIQEKYKDDRQRMQREQMALFQEHGVNPLSACLPLVFQFPVFIALYALLRSSTFKDEVIASGDPGWLFIKHLAEHPTGAEAIALIILAVAGTFALILFTPSPADRRRRPALHVRGSLLPGDGLPDPERARRHRRVLHRQRALADRAADRDPLRLAAAVSADARGGQVDQGASAAAAEAQAASIAAPA